MLIKRAHSCLVLVHVQARLVVAVHEPEPVVANLRVLLQAARRLGIPALAPELNPRGLGPTVPDVAELADVHGQQDMHFSCMGDRSFASRLRGFGREQVVLAGMEAHVCVLQAAMDMLRIGTKVFVVEDAASSRRPENVRAALDRLRAAGAATVTTEMVVFEWMERADIPEFRDLLRLIK